MKSLIPKLKKEYSLFITPIFKTNLKDQLTLEKTDTFYSMTHLYPTQTFEPNTYVQVPLDLFAVTRKNIKLKYLMTQLNHTTKTIRTELKELELLYLTHQEIKFSHNIGLILKNQTLRIDAKIILHQKANSKKCSKIIEQELRADVGAILLKYTTIEDLLMDLYNRQFTKKIANQLTKNQQFVKSIVITKIKNL